MRRRRVKLLLEQPSSFQLLHMLLALASYEKKLLICLSLLAAHLTVVIAFNNINTSSNNINSSPNHLNQTSTTQHLSGTINQFPISGPLSSLDRELSALSAIPQSNQQAGGQQFERLLERILRPIQLLGRPSMLQNPDPIGMREGVAADPNNRTSMRFFRNNKTFASIVYINNPDSLVQTGRRLINCHLVDLEKHSSDVALFEAKYDLRTVDIEFRDMMQLIDACTYIARPKTPARPSSLLASPGHSSSPSSSSSGSSSQPASRHGPLLVIGRPGDSTPLLSSSSGNSGASKRRHKRNRQPVLNSPGNLQVVAHVNRQHSQQQQQQQQQHQQQFNQVAAVNAATSQYHKGQQQNGQVIAGAKIAQVVTQQQQHINYNYKTQSHTSHAHEPGGNQLVIGEVTPPPSLSDGNGPGLREAIAEISTYDTSDLLTIWRGIMPGTNWCGMGDRATSYNDLGFEADIDICCRAHDFCPIRLSAFSSGYGLFNWSFYTRSHCWCDQNFLDCLQRSSSPIAAVVMRFYFNIMKTTCLHDNQTLTVTPGDANQRSPFGSGHAGTIALPISSGSGSGTSSGSGGMDSNANKKL